MRRGTACPDRDGVSPLSGNEPAATRSPVDGRAKLVPRHDVARAAAESVVTCPISGTTARQPCVIIGSRRTSFVTPIYLVFAAGRASM